MATRKGQIVRCPVYLIAPSQGQKPGCGGTKVKRIDRSGFEFECQTCEDWFDAASVDFDRQVLADPALKARHDQRLAATGLY